MAAPQASLTTRVNALVVLSAMLYAAGMLVSCTPLVRFTLPLLQQLWTLAADTAFICCIMLCTKHVWCWLLSNQQPSACASWYLITSLDSDSVQLLLNNSCRAFGSRLKHSAGAGLVQQDIESEQLALLVNALCSDAVRSVDQAPAQQQLLAVIFNTITLAGKSIGQLSGLLCTDSLSSTMFLVIA